MNVERPSWRLATRVDQPEWLDQGIGTPEAVAQSLSDLNRINRWLGGTRSLTRYLYPRLLRWLPEAATILDLGSGGCEIPLSIARWARQQGVSLRVLALDVQLQHLRWAQGWLQAWPQISLIHGDALAPPFRAGGIDVVISSLFLHHFSEKELTQRLPIWAGLARRSLIMTDLVRHPIPYYFMKVAGPVFARSPLTRHDAEVSIRRAYTPRELRQIVRVAGLPGARIFTCFPYRMTLVIDQPEVSAT